MADYVFQRSEKKYLVEKGRLNSFLEDIKERIIPDRYGEYKICNVYFDTEDDFLVRTSNEKPPYKEKLRMRSYGTIDEEGRVFLEIKKKYDGIVYKRRVSMTHKEAMEAVESKKMPQTTGQIGREIEYFLKRYNVSPKLYLSYERRAFSGLKETDLRITVDDNILSRYDDVSLVKGDWGEKLLPEGYLLMEIKTASAFPLWLAKALSEYEITPTSFSKYGNIYRKNITANMEIQNVF
ncbi:MAG: polyphosphate polymerase domain-containing protein [Clostridia bacterium]|nr:polyphosphate polymerase domain-containing protein [Clostridia bacterium]